MWEHHQHHDERHNKINDRMTNACLSAEEPELALCPARQGQGTTELGMAGLGMAGLPLKLTPELRTRLQAELCVCKALPATQGWNPLGHRAGGVGTQTRCAAGAHAE